MNLSPTTLCKLALCVFAAVQVSSAGGPPPPPNPPGPAPNLALLQTLQLAAGTNIDGIIAGKGDLKKLRNLGSTLTDAELGDANSCLVYTHILHLIGSRVQDLPEACIRAYLGELTANRRCPQTAAGIPTAWVGAHGRAIMDALIAANALHLVSNSLLKALFENKNDECTVLTAELIEKLPKGNKAILTAGCFAAMLTAQNAPDAQGVIQNASIVSVNGLRQNILAEYDGPLSKKTAQSVAATQAASFAKNVSSDFVCENTNIALFPKAVIPSLPLRCLRGYFSKAHATAFPKGKINTLPESLFKVEKDELATIVASIHKDNYKELDSKFLKMILADAEVIASLPSDVVFKPKALDTVTLSPAAFGALAARSIQAASNYLAGAAKGVLDDKVLSECTAENVRTFTYKTSGNDYSGVKFLALLKSHPNFNAIIENATAESTHFCSLIEKAEDYLELTFRRALALSKRCRGALPFDTSVPSFLKKALEFANDENVVLAAIESYTTDEWKRASPALIDVMAAHPKFCEGFTVEIFNALASETYKYLPSECMLVVKDKITTENVGLLGDKAFSAFSPSDLVKVKIANLSPSQVSFLPARSFFAGMDAEQFASLSAAQVAALSAEQFAVLPAEHFAKITADIMKEVPSANLASVTDKQLESLPETTVLAMSAEQVAKIGSESKASLSALSKASQKFDDAQSVAFKARSSTSSESSYFWYYLSAAALFVVIAAGAVFFFVRK